jgi:riboflavin synthase
MGIVRSRDDAATSTRLVIDDRGWEHRPELGDSIAINGCCLTLTGRDEGLAFDMVPTTLLGGHLVQGHVEGVGTIQSNGDEASEGWKMKIQPPAEVAPFLVDRGSVTVEGVSLTIAGWNGSVLSLALIPETLQRTTLGGLLAGDEVNLEPDCLAKMVAAMLEQRGLIPPGSGVPGS